MKFLFLAAPAYGHLNPQLGIMSKLTEEGHQVVAYNTKEFAHKIKLTGSEFRLPPFKIVKFDLRQMNSALNIAEKILEVTEEAVPGLDRLVKKEKFDCIAYDALSLWGKIIGIKNNLPSIALVPSMAINARVMLAYTKYLMSDYIMELAQPLRTLKILQRYSMVYKNMHRPVPPIYDLFMNKSKLNIVFTSKYFQPCGETFSDDYQFVGPIIFNRKEESIPTRTSNASKKIIYIALGTVYNDNIKLYKTLINSFANSSYQVLISIGNYIKQSDLGIIPSNVYIKKYLPQLEILKKASIFISHAGMNSINESLYFGVPMLLLPIIQEQQVNAARVEELGAGIYFKSKNISREDLQNLVSTLLKVDSYKKNAMKISRTLVEAGGVDYAVRAMISFTNSNSIIES